MIENVTWKRLCCVAVGLKQRLGSIFRQPKHEKQFGLKTGSLNCLAADLTTVLCLCKFCCYLGDSDCVICSCNQFMWLISLALVWVVVGIPTLSTSASLFSYFCPILLKASVGSRWVLYWGKYRDSDLFLDMKMADSKGISSQDSTVSAGAIGSDLVRERIEPGILEARSENQPEPHLQDTRS